MSPRPQTICLLATAVAIGLLSCGPHGLHPREGYVHVPGGRVWYRIVGSGTRTPLLVLHGGPGVPSTYLKPLAALADERPVVFYDQLGAGKSDHPRDTTLWRMERFLAELAAVRESLGLREIHLYGHSFGTMLAIDYLLQHPTGVRSAILAGPVLSYPQVLRDDDSLKRTLPDSIRRVLARHERDGSCDDPEYQAAMVPYYKRFFARRQPWSVDLDSAVRGVDPAPDEALFGRCDRGGPIATYDRTGQVGTMAVPALFMVGAYDPTTPAATRSYQRLWPGAELAIFDSSGHLPMQDEPARYVAAIRDFLRRVERR
jgi:proline-specific peptidase